MANKTKKAQVVLAVIDQESHSFAFLLLQTNEKRGSFWQNVTGKVENNETFEEGGLREAIEETALPVEKIVDLIPLGLTFEFTDSRERRIHEECFLLVLESRWQVKIDPHEHQSFHWVNAEDLRPESVKHASNFECLKKSLSLLTRWGK